MDPRVQDYQEQAAGHVVQDCPCVCRELPYLLYGAAEGGYEAPCEEDSQAPYYLKRNCKENGESGNVDECHYG